MYRRRRQQCQERNQELKEKVVQAKGLLRMVASSGKRAMDGVW